MPGVECARIRDDHRVRCDPGGQQGPEGRVYGHNEASSVHAAQIVNVAVQRWARGNNDERNAGETSEQTAGIGIPLVFEVADGVMEVHAAVLEVREEVGCPISEVRL